MKIFFNTLARLFKKYTLKNYLSLHLSVSACLSVCLSLSLSFSLSPPPLSLSLPLPLCLMFDILVFPYRIQRLSGERDHHKSCVARSTRQQEVLERTLAQEAEKLRQLSSRLKVTSNKLKDEKDEVG